MFHTKRNVEVDFLRRKERLVANVFTKIEGIYFSEVFSFVSRYSEVLLIISVLIKQKHKLQILDINNAFVAVELKETIYVFQT